jgi:ABC-2 type transport system permease protein
MHNMFLIARREYLERVRSKAFLFMTIFIPVLMFGATVLPTLIATRMTGSTKHIVVAATDLQTAEVIRAQLLKPPSGDGNEDLNSSPPKRGTPAPSRYEVDVDTNVSDAQRIALTEKVKQKQLDGVVWATDDALAANKITYITRDISNLNDTFGLNQTVSRAVHRRILLRKGLTDTDIDAALKPVGMETVNASGSGSSNPLVTFFSVFGMVMVLYMTVLLYGINVMRAVLDEKSSRIMEVMLSTATAKEMMVGKILGVGAVGLTQVAIWATTTGILSQGIGLAASGTLKGVISLRLAIYFPVFFLLGFVLFSTMYAAIGAMVNSEQEAQQLQFLVAMPLIASVIVLVQILQNPATPLATWASIFPLTAPLIMFTRIALDPQVPSWQIALSVGLLVATIYGLMILCGRIYRVGILMYGKKPTLPEIMKWIKYA